MRDLLISIRLATVRGGVKADVLAVWNSYGAIEPGLV
jgi:hypothetical protein